ncbi:helix-turn-helix domain-containing protein [Methanobrevibacter sp. DSM 116169]|uniref:helix-turn-helix domain-containing protein n=1 Tax=Methanobrevibacter sp. DSM 116169 TaxID=3242727 RepID=UPI0038FCB063
MPEKNKIGEKIKNLMEIRNLTSEEIALNSGVNEELVEKILNGEVIPSLTPLTKIARSLGVRIGTFIDDTPQTGPLIVKKGKSDEVVYFSGDENKTDDSNLEFFSLASGKTDRNMEPFIIDIKVDTESGHELSSHEGEEFIYVLEGSIEILYGQDNYILETGDSIYYDSIVPHHLHSYDDKGSKILAVIYTPY